MKANRLIALLLVLLLMAACAQAEVPDTVSVTVTYGQTEARSMLAMVNSFRTGSDAWYWDEDETTKIQCTNLQPLVYDAYLEQIAMQRAAELVLSFAHMRPDGVDCFEAYVDVLGNAYYAYFPLAENIAAGQTTAQSAYTMWREDDFPSYLQGHRRNMLGDFTAIGIGHAIYNGVHFWVQEFGAPYSPNTSLPAATNSNQAVTIAISEEQVSSFSVVKPTATALQVPYGSTVSLPAINGSLTMLYSVVGAVQVGLPNAWTGDGKFAQVSGGQVTGRTVGKGQVTARVAGETFTLPVTVSYDFLPVEFQLPARLTTVSAQAFQNTAVKAVSIPKGAKTIGPNAFAQCKQLKQVTIPSTVTTIDPTAFTGAASSLAVVCVEGSAADTFARQQGFKVVWVVE